MTNPSTSSTSKARIRLYRTVRKLMVAPAEVVVTTLPGGSRWASDSFTAVDLTACGLAEAFADLPDADGYRLRRNRPPVQSFSRRRDPAEVAAKLAEHAAPHDGRPVGVSRYTLASDNGRKPPYVRFLAPTSDQGDLLVVVNGPAYDAWSRLLSARRPAPSVELVPSTEEPERLELGMVRWKAAGRVLGLLMAVRPVPFPLLPGPLLAAAGTRPRVTAATDALTDAAARLRTAVTELRAAGLPQLAGDIGDLAERAEANTDRLTA